MAICVRESGLWYRVPRRCIYTSPLHTSPPPSHPTPSNPIPHSPLPNPLNPPYPHTSTVPTPPHQPPASTSSQQQQPQKQLLTANAPVPKSAHSLLSPLNLWIKLGLGGNGRKGEEKPTNLQAQNTAPKSPHARLCGP